MNHAIGTFALTAFESLIVNLLFGTSRTTPRRYRPDSPTPWIVART
jgi:hypothetical protein